MIIDASDYRLSGRTVDTFEVTNVKHLEVARSTITRLFTLTDGRRCRLKIAARLNYSTGDGSPLLILDLVVNGKHSRYCRMITPGAFVTMNAQRFELRPADAEHLHGLVDNLAKLVVDRVPTIVGL